jgi:hypothetical protein
MTSSEIEPERPSNSGEQPTQGSTGLEPESGRWRYGVNVVLAGLAFMFLSLLAALIMYYDVADATKSATAVATVLAPITTVIGTIVGAYFGIQSGAVTAERAQASRDTAETQARQLAAVAPADDAARITGAPTR